jgi:predicted transcriptional regulator
MTLLSMPDHLRKTAMTVCRLGRATAEETAEQTHRARAVESAYLNQLVTMGYLKKERNGRKAYFYVETEPQQGGT